MPAPFRVPSPLLTLALATLVLGAPGHAPAADGEIHFNRDIRPILSENCFQCHGPDSAKREADLRLDRRDDALEALAWVPGKPDQSDALRRILSDDPDERMPPLKSNRSLTPAQKDLLRRWIAEGATYEAHWSYVPPKRPAVPSLPGQVTVENPIDAFLDASLARAGIPPSPEADRRTLIRRLSLDLTGLPPKPEEADAFAASRDPGAYRRWVRHYLASPHFGERLAVPWLDLVRFADTIGFHNDVAIRVWPYRDYVIDAFNRNLPFDQFTREQLAGDLLPGSTPWQRVASGYNRIHRISGEGGIQDKEYFAKYSADRVRTTATVWMGSTLACAECHDHKYDPFTIRDFYSFAAIFADLREKGAYNLSGGFTRDNLTEETLFESPEQQRKVEALEAEIARLGREIEAMGDDRLAEGRRAWEAGALSALQAGTLAWRPVRPIATTSTAGTPFSLEDDLSVVPGGRNPVHDTYEVTVPAGDTPVTAVAVEVIQDARFPGDEVSRGGSAFFISEIEVLADVGNGTPRRPLRRAAGLTSSATEPGHPASAAVDDNPATAVSFVRKRGGAIAVHLAEPWIGGPGSRLTVRLVHSSEHPYQHVGRFRVALHSLPAPDPHPEGLPGPVLAALRVDPADRSAAQQRELAAHYRRLAPELAAPLAARQTRMDERDHLLRVLPSMPVSRSVEPRVIRVLPRGDWMNDSGDVVEPAIPEVFGRLSPSDGRRVSRLDFADWLVAPDNPLTARTFVNRLWKLYFGEGLTRTVEDLGSQGEWPSHPELLDWLAVEFRESGWNIKHLVELIVTSRAYRRSSRPHPDAAERDPTNRLLARQGRFRLEAEHVRDVGLAASGLLVPRIGGPSVRPYQPEGYYAPLNFPRREYVQDTGEGLHRRGVYTHWQRTFLHPALMAFDAPARDECAASRSTSNTPLQALVLLNDPTQVEAARVLAGRILREGGPSFRSRIDWAFRRVLSRPPEVAESRMLRRLLDDQHRRYARDREAAFALVSTGSVPVPAGLDVAEHAAWTAISRALLNLHETITRL